MRILTWHVHGTYLWSLAHLPHDLYLPTKPDRPPGYGGRAGARDWPANVQEVPVEQLPALDVDLVLYQSQTQWAEREQVLGPSQLLVPQVFLEHDPPRASPTDTPHPVDDPDVLVVHVTPFNRLMWDNGRSPTAVVEHGVDVPDDIAPPALGEGLLRGIVVVNDLATRGRRLGADIYEAVRHEVPLDLVGMGSEHLGGRGEVPPPKLPTFLAPYRFYFHPVRYTSLGLALCEAMAVGVPIVGLATTELPSIVTHGVDGFVSNDVDELVEIMRGLLDDEVLARRVGAAGRALARERFSIDRFVRDWDRVLTDWVAQHT